MAGAFLLSDIDGMLRTDEFAVAALVLSGDRMGDWITGIYTAPYSEGLGVAGSLPEFVVKDDGTPKPKQGDQIEISDSNYRIRSIEPDSTGVLRFELNEV